MATLWTGLLAIMMLASQCYSQEIDSANNTTSDTSSVTFLTIDSNIEESSVTTNHFLTGETITEETLTETSVREHVAEELGTEIADANSNSQTSENISSESTSTVETTVSYSNLATDSIGGQSSSTSTAVVSEEAENSPSSQLSNTFSSEEKPTTQISNTLSSEENNSPTQPVEVPVETVANTVTTTMPPTYESSAAVTSTTLQVDLTIPDDTTSTAPTTVSVPSSNGASETTSVNSLTDNYNISSPTTQIFVSEDNPSPTIIATESHGNSDESITSNIQDGTTDQHKQGRSITFNSHSSTTIEFTAITESTTADILVNETSFDALVDTSTSHSVGNHSHNTTGPILVTASAGYQPTSVEVVCIIAIIFNLICCLITCYCAYRVMKRKHVCSYDLPPLTSTFSEIDNSYGVGRRNMGVDLSPEDTESALGRSPSRKPKSDSAIVISSDDGWCVPYDPTKDTEMKLRENSNDDKNEEEDIRL